MRVAIKYLSLGLVIGMLAGSLLLTGMILINPPNVSLFFSTSTGTRVANTPLLPTHTLFSPPTFTGTPSPTTLPPRTLTPFITATPNPIQSMVNSGQLIFTGPLSTEQQISLYETSLNYIAATTQQSLLLSKYLNNVRYGNPSNTCGPLAMAIMKDAGLVNADINPHDFWLLNPTRDGDRVLLNNTFPPNNYEDTRYKIPLNKFDWKTHPLETGDFLYIYSGTGGNFDHMLVVNRVDSGLRTYAVTNINTPNGFIIIEVLLYDPGDSTGGIFHTWTETQYAILGSTGFGGFELWRLRSP